MHTKRAVRVSATTFIVAAACGAFGILAVAARTAPSGGTDVQATQSLIEDAERRWVEAVTTGDTAVVETTLSDDFTGTAPDGNAFDKKVMVDLIRGAPQEYISNRLDGMTVKFYGDVAIAQGSETWERRTQLPKKGRFVWTDTWMLRGGKWQIIAGADFELPTTEVATSRVSAE